MSDAPLQPAPAPLRVDDIYQTFIALCVDTEGAFETACVAAAVRGFTQFDPGMSFAGGPVKRVAEAAFRKPGFFFATAKLLAEAPDRSSRTVQNSSLSCRPASYRQLAAVLASDLGVPTATNATPGVQYIFVGDPRSTPALKSRAEADRRVAAGESELVVIAAWEVRDDPSRPGDAVALSYQRWSE